MKNQLLSTVCLITLCVAIGCQPKDEPQTVQRRNPNASARRVCNTVYKFLYPETGYTYAGGCLDYLIVGGQTRQFKVVVSNPLNYTDSKQLQIECANQPSLFQYSVASTTGGSTSSSIDSNGLTKYIFWEITDMPAFATYELLLNVYVPSNAPSGENTVHLTLLQPCLSSHIYDCDADENLHLVRTY